MQLDLLFWLVMLFATPALSQAQVLKDGRLDINVSGSNGGGSGSDGQGAGDINLNLQYADAAKTSVAITGQYGDEKINETVPLSELKRLTLEAVGGDGADGRRGSDGRDGSKGQEGRPGSSGRDGCPPGDGQAGSQGSNGTNGDDGGRGGGGGNGGRGGNISVHVPQDQTELLLLVKAVTSPGDSGSGGVGGRGGRRGEGGRGGMGGHGGRGTCKDPKGNPINSHGRDGWKGSDGSSGRDGSNGSRGWDGNKGTPGAKSFVVTNAAGQSETYHDSFHLAPTDFKTSDENEDGILEPGEKLNLLSVTVVNKGAMPSPAGQVLKLSILAGDILSPVVQPDVTIAEVIPAGGKITLTFVKGAVVLQALDQTSAIGKDVDLKLQMAINSVAMADNYDLGLTLHWPVAIFAEKAEAETYFEVAKKATFTIKNISSRDVGPGGSEALDVQFIWQSKTVPASDVFITLPNGQKVSLESSPIVSDFKIAASSTFTLPVVALVQNSKNAMTGDGNLRVELHLKDLSSGDTDMIDASKTNFALALDLRPTKISKSFDLRNQGITCNFPQSVFKNYDIQTLNFAKDAGSDQVSVQYYTNGFLQNTASPVYAISAFDYARYAKELSNNPTRESVVNFLNGEIVAQTRSGQANNIISSCSLRQ